MSLRERLESHPATNLRKAISKANKELNAIRGYHKMKKAELVEAMLKFPERFEDIEFHSVPKRERRKLSEAEKEVLRERLKKAREAKGKGKKKKEPKKKEEKFDQDKFDKELEEELKDPEKLKELGLKDPRRKKLKIKRKKKEEEPPKKKKIKIVKKKK